MFDPLIETVDHWITQFAALFPADTLWSHDFNLIAMLAILFVSLMCGAMGALVVGNRMAFFSDALAHCAFAGVGLGIAFTVLTKADRAEFRTRITEVMVAFGILVGILIAYVRDRTGLASDTVIGVFFAGAIGIGAVFTKLVPDPSMFSLEEFIFGNPTTASAGEMLVLGALAIVVALFLWWMNNYLVLVSASSSLALSRRVPVRWCHYLLIIVLAVMVNLSLRIVGALLINGLLIVPAAAAANVARNLRQMFWYSVVIAVASGIGGYLLSWEVNARLYPRHSIGTVGVIVLLAVVLFAVTIGMGRLARERVQPEKEYEGGA